MASAVDENDLGAWLQKLDEAVTELQNRTSVTINQYVITVDDYGNLVVVNTLSGTSTTVAT